MMHFFARMNAPLHVRRWIGPLVLVFVFTAPNMLLLQLDPDRQHLIWLITSAGLCAIWIAAFPTIRQAVAWALPMFVLMPLIGLFIRDYQEFPATNVIGILRETTQHEAQDFAVGRANSALLMLAVSLSIWALLLIVTHGKPGRRAAIARGALALRYGARGMLLVLAAMIVLATTPRFTGVAAVSAKGGIDTSQSLTSLPFQLNRLANVFPVGPLVSAADFYIGERNRHEWQAMKVDRRFGVVSQPADTRRRVYVLVIGESSRGDRWQLGGYARNTNPLLGREANVTYLRDIVTPWTFTLASVPVITSRKSGADRSRFFAEKSIVSLFKEAGFRTTWISNQARPSGIGSEIADISSEADERQWLNIAARDYERDTTYDAVLADRLRATLASDEPRQFIVLHLMGSHDAYRSRYPKTFDRFRPSLTDAPEANDHDRANREMIGNSYDNTIVYTDYVLHAVLDNLKQSGAEAGLFYTSDHGESLFDGACDFIGHGGTTRENYAISALVWLSKGLADRRPEAAAALKRNASKRLSTENVFESLAGMAGIDYAGANPARNIFSAKFEEAERHVNVGTKSVNWDRARFEGACRKPIASPDASQLAGLSGSP